MPFRDGTGPYGQGSMTGWGAGPCAGGFTVNRKYVYGRGFGRGNRRWFSPVTKEEALRNLEQYTKDLEEELERVKEEKKGLTVKK